MPGHPDEGQLQEWSASTRGHERVAAVIARWVRERPKWEMVPEPGVLGIDAPHATFAKACNVLVRLGVLVKDGNDYFAAIDPPPAAGPES